MKRFVLFSLLLWFFGCASGGNNYNTTMQPVVSSKNAKIVADITFKVPSSSRREYYYRFAPGDTVIINAWVIKGNDISRFNVRPYRGSIVFDFMKMPYVLNKRFVSDTGGIYVFSLYNTSSFKSKIYRLVIHRVPSSAKFSYFNPSVFWDTIYDTTYRWVKESTLVRYDKEAERLLFRGILLGKGSHRCMKIDIPRSTSYIVYMVGIGRGFLEGISAASGTSSLSLFEKGTILRPIIRRIKGNATIDYAFDYSARSAVRFFEGHAYSPLRGARDIIVDFGRLHRHSDCYLCVKNNSHQKEVNVFADVVAIRKKGVYSYSRVRKPFIKMYRIPR